MIISAPVYCFKEFENCVTSGGVKDLINIVAEMKKLEPLKTRDTVRARVRSYS